MKRLLFLSIVSVVLGGQSTNPPSGNKAPEILRGQMGQFMVLSVGRQGVPENEQMMLVVGTPLPPKAEQTGPHQAHRPPTAKEDVCYLFLFSEFGNPMVPFDGQGEPIFTHVLKGEKCRKLKQEAWWMNQLSDRITEPLPRRRK